MILPAISGSSVGRLRDALQATDDIEQFAHSPLKSVGTSEPVRLRDSRKFSESISKLREDVDERVVQFRSAHARTCAQ